jgi:hypothetical protein
MRAMKILFLYFNEMLGLRNFSWQRYLFAL